MNAKDKILDTVFFITKSIDTMTVLSMCVDDAYVPNEQKIMRLQKLQEVCKSSNEKFTELFAPLKDKETRAEVKNVNKGFEVIYNHVQSIMDMIADGEFTKEEKVYFLEKQEYRFKKLGTLISGMSKKRVDKLVKAIHEDSGLVVTGDGTEENVEGADMKVIASKDFPEIDQVLRRFGHYLKMNERYRKDIPTSSTLPAVLRKMPILPTFTGAAPDAEDFSMAGFDVDKIGNNYVVLNQQIVVGVNIKIVTEVKARKRGSKQEEDKNEFVVALHEQLEEQIGAPLQRIGGSTGTPGFQWFWFVRESALNRLNSRGKRLNVKEWDFALSRYSQRELDEIHALDEIERDKQLTMRSLPIPEKPKKEDDAVPMSD